MFPLNHVVISEKHPPCANLIIKHQIPNVVIGCVDSFSEVSGKGIQRLKDNNCTVTVGILEGECKAINKRFFTFHTKKRPHIILKWAESSDGFIAPKSNTEITWITNTFSRQLVHKLRTDEQAILVGTNTAITDNPKLDCRTWKGNNPVRIVIDRSLKIPLNNHLLDRSIKTIILTEKEKESSENLFFEGVNFLGNITSQICDVLYKHQIQSVIIEGGSKTLQSFIDKKLWDEAYVFKGVSSFLEGIKAPGFKGKLIESRHIKEDQLSIYKMIKNIIFDFGDIFINLDKMGAMKSALELFSVPDLTSEMIQINMDYEKGLITTEKFLTFYTNKYPHISKNEIIKTWNCMLLNFPLHRLDFIKHVSKKYRCFLLSNTNEMHIDWIKNDWGIELYNDFKNCFEQFYLSHEMNMRKPDVNIYEFVLNENNLIASETLFIDDTKENTDTTTALGIYSWNLDPEKEDIVDLFSVKPDIF